MAPRKFTGHEISTMLQHGVTNDRRLNPLSPLLAGFPHHFDVTATNHPKKEKPAGSRLPGDEVPVMQTPG